MNHNSAKTIRTINNEGILKVKPKRHNTNYNSTTIFKVCQVLGALFSSYTKGIVMNSRYTQNIESESDLYVAFNGQLGKIKRDGRLSESYCKMKYPNRLLESSGVL